MPRHEIFSTLAVLSLVALGCGGQDPNDPTGNRDVSGTVAQQDDGSRRTDRELSPSQRSDPRTRDGDDGSPRRMSKRSGRPQPALTKSAGEDATGRTRRLKKGEEAQAIGLGIHLKEGEKPPATEQTGRLKKGEEAPGPSGTQHNDE